MNKIITKALDSLAAIVLIVAVGLIVVVLFSVLTIFLGWLVIPALAIVGAVAWAVHRGWIRNYQ